MSTRHLCGFLWRTPRGTARLRVSGDTHGRNFGSTLARCGIHRLFGALLPLGLSVGQVAHALPPLVKAADLAQQDLQGFWRSGEFIVGMTHLPSRPALMPLEGSTPLSLPRDMSAWTDLGQTCEQTPRHHARLGGLPVESVVGGDYIPPTVELWMRGRPVAEALLGRPARVCEIQIAEADSIAGLEILVAWRLTADERIRGFTVYRVPESLDPTPVRPPE